MKRPKPSAKPSAFAALAAESSVGRRLARLREQPELRRGKRGRLIISWIVPDTTDAPEDQWPVTRISRWWRLDPFALRMKGDPPAGGELLLTVSETEPIQATVAQLRQDPRYTSPPERQYREIPPACDGGLPGGVSLTLADSEPARDSTGQPAKALPPSRTQFLDDPGPYLGRPYQIGGP